MNTPTISSKSCPECGGLPGVYPNNVCPTCYVKKQLEQKESTISEKTHEILQKLQDTTLGVALAGNDTPGYIYILHDAEQAILKEFDDFAERITPEKKPKVYKAKPGQYYSFQPQVEQHKRQGWNEAIDLITQNVKAELGAAPINSKEDV